MLQVIFVCLFVLKSWIVCYILCFLTIFWTFWNSLYLGKKGFFFINGGFLFFLMLKSNYVLWSLMGMSQFYIYDILTVYSASLNLDITIGLFFDVTNFSYVNLTVTIGSCVYFYAYGYMRHEILIERFLFLLLFFLYGMVWLLLANNLFSLLIGWEVIGITSYFLINFWTTKVATFKAAFKAFIFNRLSDVSLLLIFFYYYYFFKTYWVTIESCYVGYFNFTYVELGSLKLSNFDLTLVFFLVAASCKSAQFGFHVWLPDSMEAPVPASALIHSATLVSAGIYLLNKVWYFLYFSFYWYHIFFLMVSWTSWYGAMIAIYQTDLKRILAYSTISHCGALFLISYLNNFYIITFYLYAHGLFKSLSFMCVGNIIQTNLNIQDYRFMGNRWKYHKLEFFVLLVSMANLSGYIFTLGFFTKHYLLNNVIWLNFFIVISTILFSATAFVGFWYTFLLMYFVFFGYHRSNKPSGNVVSTSYTPTTPFVQTLAIGFLGFYSLIILTKMSYFIYFSKFFDLNFFFPNGNFFSFEKKLVTENLSYFFLNSFLIIFFTSFFYFIIFGNYFYSFFLLGVFFIKLFLILNYIRMLFVSSLLYTATISIF